jgi:flagellar biogenesis protein FliO
MHARALFLVVTLAAPALHAESAAGDPIDNLVPEADRAAAQAPATAGAAVPDTPPAALDEPPWPHKEWPREARAGAPPPLGISDVVAPILKTFLMLAVVLAIAYLTLHKGLGKLVERQTAGKRVKVVERIGLDQKRTLYLVDVDGQQMLLGASDHGLTHLKDVTAPPANPDARPGFGARFAEALDRNKEPRSPVVSVPRTNDSAIGDDAAVEGVKS